MDRARRDHTRFAASLRGLAWMTVVAGASVGFSLAFACATPFAALGAVAALQLPRREAIGAILLAWTANQAIGYLVLGYPRTWDSFAWGGAIGIAAVLAVVLAMMTAGLTRRAIVGAIVAFAAAFLAYEGTLRLASLGLPSEGDAFAMRIVVRMLEVNMVAYAGLTVIHHLAVGAGLLAPAPAHRAAAA